MRSPCLPGIVLIWGLAACAMCRAEGPSTQAVAALRTSDLVAVAQLAERFFEAVPDPSRLNVESIVAFEEHPRFVYLAGRAVGLRRRVVLLKPNVFVVDDRVRIPADGKDVRWTLRVEGEPMIDGGKLEVAGEKGEISGETVLPEGASFRIVRPARGGGDSTEAVVELVAGADGREARLVHVFEVRAPGGESSGLRCALDRNQDGRQLTVSTAAGTLRLGLPAGRDDAGTIAVAAADGRPLVGERLLPSGIMPHGEEGVGLLARWDTPYQDGRRPGWDTGRVAPELKKAVEGGSLSRGRAVVLGCGSGTNAIYLAGKGYDVTGVDVAPTALGHAEQKAREAGVDVRWILADVLALPDLGPFDLVFDRGCYHHIRQYDSAGYVEAVDRLSRPGTRLLLLAGSARETRRSGPPKVKEEEIRNDFSALFDIEWLREIRFDPVNPEAEGPLAWSVLLRRKENR